MHLGRIQPAAVLALALGASLMAGCPAGKKTNEGKPSASGAAGTPLAPLRLPPIHEARLDNGLEVLVVENHETPTVTVTVFWKDGAETDPADKAGLTSMTASLLRQGTKTRSAAEIAETIDALGGSLGGSADLDGAELSVSVLKKDFAVALELLADIAANPSFPEEEIEIARRQEIAGARQSFDDPSELTRRHLRVILYGESHPYSFFPSERSLAAIRREDLVEHHRRWFGPGNAVVGVAGDVGKDEAMAAVRAAFGTWTGAKEADEVAFPETPKPARAVRLVDKPDLTQSSIRVAAPGIDRKSPDYHAAVVMNYILGGGAFSSRLVRVVRSDEGKTYGIGSGFTVHKRRGVFGIGTSTRNAETVPTLDLVLREVDKIRAEGTGVTPAELAAAKSNLIGSYPMRFETADDVLGRLFSAKLHGLPFEEITEYRQKIAAVTLEEVNAAARKYLDPDRMVIVVVGRSSEVKAPLETRFGPVEVVDFLEPTHAVDKKQR